MSQRASHRLIDSPARSGGNVVQARDVLGGISFGEPHAG
jgi:hypothetical protein